MTTFMKKWKIFQKISQTAPPLNITLGLNPSTIFIEHPKAPLWTSLVSLVPKMKDYLYGYKIVYDHEIEIK